MARVTNFSELGQLSNTISVGPKNSFSYAFTVAAEETFDGAVVLEKTKDNGISWERVASFTGAASGTVTNQDSVSAQYRFRCSAFEEGSDNLTLSFEELNDVVNVHYEKSEVVSYAGTKLIVFKEDGVYFSDVKKLDGTPVGGANNISSYESVTTNGDAPVEMSNAHYESRITSGGSAGGEDLSFDSVVSPIVGQRKLVTFENQTDESDAIALPEGEISQAGDTISTVVLNVSGDFILLEWRGSKWEVIAASDGVVTTA